MSVINQMLRDLDRRQAGGAAPPASHGPRTGPTRGTRVVDDASRVGPWQRSPRLGVMLLAALGVPAAVLAVWWYLNQNPSLPRREQAVSLPAATKSPPLAAASAGPTMVPDDTPRTALAGSAVLPLPASDAAPVIAASAQPVVVVPARLSANTAAAVSAPARLLASASAAHTAVLLPMDNALQGEPSAGIASRASAAGTPRPVPQRPATELPSASVSTVAGAKLPAAPTPERPAPALETLAQAQNLWSAGRHEAAMDLLRQELATAERADVAGTTAANPSALTALARELARMEMAEGRVSQALALLTRLEPSVAGSAEVWALRGNAAQRLGRHQESVAAYLSALRLRPDQPRWMLGAAVSLAAQGETASAAEWAEKARAGGVLSAEVANYLRQLGVPLGER